MSNRILIDTGGNIWVGGYCINNPSLNKYYYLFPLNKED